MRGALASHHRHRKKYGHRGESGIMVQKSVISINPSSTHLLCHTEAPFFAYIHMIFGTLPLPLLANKNRFATTRLDCSLACMCQSLIFPHRLSTLGSLMTQSGECMPTAVIFDFGNVICHFDNALFLRRLTSYTDKTFDELESLIYHSSDLVRQYEIGLVSSDAFVDSVTRTCSLSISRSEFVEAFTEIFSENQQVIDLIRMLKPKYKLGLLSNTNELDYQRAIMTCPVFDMFDSVTTSFHVGALKPSKEIYEDALRKLQVSAEECIYVDDIGSYVEGAKAIGLNGIHYSSYQRLVSSLEDLGIHVQQLKTHEP